MNTNKKLYGGILGAVGFLLSPLSWWNDLFINFPIAYIFACAVNYIYKGSFLAAFIIFYWLTNVTGFILLQKGMEKMIKDDKQKTYSGKDFLRDAVLSMVYTLLIVILVKLGIIKPII